MTMPTKPILIAPAPELRKLCTPVDAVDERINRLMKDMLDTMYHADGIGLAAPQIGILERVIVLDVARRDEPSAPMCLANPEVLWASKDTSTHNEGCLSFPDLYADVTRPASVHVRYLDQDNQSREIEATDLLAVCLQHEIDHLNGVLFVDHLSKLKRDMILRKLKKGRKGAEAA